MTKLFKPKSYILYMGLGLRISHKFLFGFERTPQIIVIVIFALYILCTNCLLVGLVKCLKYSMMFTEKIFPCKCDMRYNMFFYVRNVNINHLHYITRTLTRSFISINIKRCVCVEAYDYFARHQLIDYSKIVCVLWTKLFTLNVCLVDMCTELTKVIIWNWHHSFATELCFKNINKSEKHKPLWHTDIVISSDLSKLLQLFFNDKTN